MAKPERRIAQVNALNYIYSTAYDANSNPIQMTDPLNRISTNVMDPLGRVQASISPLGYISTTNWDASGRQVSNQTANGAVWSNVFDNASRQIASVSPLGYRSSTTFDSANRIIGEQNPLGFIYSTVLDAAGRPVATVNPLNYRTSAVFDAASQRVASIDALGNYATSVFSPIGSLIAQQNQLGFITSFTLDAASQRTCVVDANNGLSTTTFSNRGFVSATQDQLGALTSFTQDANGNNILRVDARNWPSTYTMDALNRTAQTLYIDGTRVTNTWDQAGQQLTGADVTGIYSYLWDSDSRKIVTQNPTGINLTQTLDAVGNRLVLADPFGVTSYSWDQQSRLQTIQNPLNEVTSIQWDSLDRELHRVLGNGMTVSHTYDGAGRETLLQNISAAGVGLAIFTNSYDPLSNRLSVVELDNTRVSLSYDSTSQLISEARSGTFAYNRSYVWDGLGNRLQQYDSGVLTQRTFNAANELLLVTPASGPATTQSFDANGNLTISTTGSAITTNTWSAENALLSQVAPTVNEQYLYGQDGLRRQKVNSSGTTQFTLDGQNVLLETTGVGALQARNTQYPKGYGGLASQNRGGASNFYGFDSQQSTRILVSAGGLITDSLSFKAFGEELQTGSGTVNPFWFGGQVGYFRDLPGVMNVGKRKLIAVNGVFLNRDLIGFAGGDVNLMRYVGNNPVVWVDPSGTISYDPTKDAQWVAGTCMLAPSPPNCCGYGAGFWYLKFDTGTNGNAPCAGFLVQLNVRTSGGVLCAPNQGPWKGAFDGSYYEYWKFDKNQDYKTYGPDKSGRCGNGENCLGVCNASWQVDKTSKFYCVNTLEDVMLWNDRLSIFSTNDPSCSPSAGNAPCTTNLVAVGAWFNNPAVKSQEAGMLTGNGDWECCGNTYTSTVKYSKQPQNLGLPCPTCK